MVEKTHRFDSQSRHMWLRLYFTPRLGLRAILKLLARYTLAELAQFDRMRWLSVGLTEAQAEILLSRAMVEANKVMAWCDEHPQGTFIPYLDEGYPPLLREIDSPPSTLFVYGDSALLAEAQIALVGSRRPSRTGIEITQQWSHELIQAGLVVTSGLAAGIDGCAHVSALQSGGKTIAVLGSGFGHLYPKMHLGLAERIRHHGALVSEFAPDTQARPEYFPRRNRIISGLSLGVVVIEAAEKSGSLVTARYAAEQGRDVFVLPGSVFHANYRGSHELIRQGATLVQSSQQVLEGIEASLRWSLPNAKEEQSDLFKQFNQQTELPFPQLLANVGEEVTPIDILAERTHIPIQDVMVQLLELELLGYVESVAGGYILKGRS